MDTLHFFGVLVSILLILSKFIIQKRAQYKNLPPSPFSLPIIGHFHLLKQPVHHALLKLSNKYGPIMSLRLGSRPVLVVSTSSAIEECFTKNDIIFANRPMFPSRKILINYNGMTFSPYGSHWRNLRRLTTMEIFSSRRIQMSSSIRVEEIQFLTKQLFKSYFEGVRKVNMKTFFDILIYNIMMQMVAGNRCIDEELDSEETRGKLDDLKKMFNPNAIKTPLGDFIPFLRWLPFYGEEEKKLQEVDKKRDKFLQALVDAHRNAKSSLVTDEGRKRTIIDVMLALQESEPEYYTDNLIKGIIMLMLTGGTDTPATSMELAVFQLISHPEVLKKVRDEINANVGKSQLLDDADLAKLPYLHCILNETLRLSKLGAIILPHESSEECTIGGYDIPEGTMLMVNAWALHRDPKLWEDPNVFKPERFQVSAGEKEGLKFMPFGSGRRQCPGAALAMRLMALALGTLIQCFEWENAMEEGKDEVMDLRKASDRPVEVIFRPRETLINALSQL